MTWAALGFQEPPSFSGTVSVSASAMEHLTAHPTSLCPLFGEGGALKGLAAGLALGKAQTGMSFRLLDYYEEAVNPSSSQSGKIR